MTGKTRTRSLRALHWDEGKHPRDDRGRFSRTPGGRWAVKAVHQLEARFGDTGMAEGGGMPQGRLQTGKGGLLDISGMSKAAKAKFPRVEVPNTSTTAEPTTKRAFAIKIGDRFMHKGAEVEAVGVPRAGRKAGQQVTVVKVKRVSDNKTGPITIEGDSVRLAGPAEAQSFVEVPLGRAPGGGRVDTPRVTRQAGGVTEDIPGGQKTTLTRITPPGGGISIDEFDRRQREKWGTPAAKSADARLQEAQQIETARANFGNGPASTKPEVGRRPNGTYKYDDYSKAGYDLGNLTVAEAGLSDQGATRSQYQQILKSIDGLKRQGPARVGSKDQYYRPMTAKLEEAAQYVTEHEGNPDTVAKLRALADIYRPQGDKPRSLISAADVASQRRAMASPTGVDMNDPNRWIHGGGQFSPKDQFAAAVQRGIDRPYEHKELTDALSEFRNASIHDTEKIDAAALKVQGIADQIRAEQADLKTQREGFRARVAAAGGLASQDDAIKADRKRLKKEYGIPSDAAIKKLPPEQRRYAEGAMHSIDQAARTRVAAENNAFQVRLGQEHIAQAAMLPTSRAELERAMEKIQGPGHANPTSVATFERERDDKLAAWSAVSQGDPGEKGEAPRQWFEGLSPERSGEVARMSEQVGLDAGRRLAEEFGANTNERVTNFDYSGFDERQIAGLRSLEGNAEHHARAVESLRAMNEGKAAERARRSAALADINTIGTPARGETPGAQRAKLLALAGQFEGGDTSKLMNETAGEVPGRGVRYDATIQNRRGDRILNYDDFTGFNLPNGGRLADNEVPFYVLAYNENPTWDPQAIRNQARRAMAEAGIEPIEFRRIPVDSRPEKVQLQERLTNAKRRLEGTRDYRRRKELTQSIHEAQVRLDEIDKQERKASRAQARKTAAPSAGEQFAAETRAALAGGGIDVGRGPVPGAQLPGTARREAAAGKVQAATDALAAATSRAEGDAAVADLKGADLRLVAEKLNVNIGGLRVADARQRIVEATIGARLNSAAIRDRGNFRGAGYLGGGTSRADEVATRLKAAASRDAARVALEGLTKPELEAVYARLKADQPATPFNQGSLPGRTNKERIDHLVELAVGRNLDARAIERAGRSPGGKA